MYFWVLCLVSWAWYTLVEAHPFSSHGRSRAQRSPNNGLKVESTPWKIWNSMWIPKISGMDWGSMWFMNETQKKHPSIQSLHAVKSCPNIPKHLCILQKFAVQRSAQQPPRTGTLMYMLTLYQPVPGLKKKVAVEFPHGAVPHLGYTVYANLKSTGMSSSSCPPSNQGYLPRYKPSFQWRSVVLIDHPNILTWMYIYIPSVTSHLVGPKLYPKHTKAEKPIIRLYLQILQ